MTIDFKYKHQSLAVVLLAGLACLPQVSDAEVTLDGSLGGMPGQSVGAGNNFTYDINSNLGKVMGPNLFHSFARFNVAAGEQANFSGAANINNIIARVTGGENSLIAGKVTSSIDQASLWLVNPAGFVFSNGAVIDVGGSVTLSTGDFLAFADGAQFFSQLSMVSTLSTAAIERFGFLAAAQGSVTFNSGRGVAGEASSATQNLNVGAQAIALNQLQVVAQNIEVNMGDVAFGDITLNQASLQAIEGRLYFRGGNIEAVDSRLSAAGRGSTVDMQASSITLRGDTGPSIISSGDLQASGGDIILQARDIHLVNNAQLISASGGSRTGGNISLVGDSIVVETGSRVDLASGEGAIAGNLTVTTTNFLLRDNASMNTSSEFTGATAGSIAIAASGRFGIEGNSQLLAESKLSGDGGQVRVSADSIVIRDNSVVDVKTLGTGNADLVSLEAVTSITVDQGSTLNASTSGSGNGGDIRLAAATISIDAGNVVGAVNGTGLGGDIIVSGGQVNISGGTKFNVSSFSPLDSAGNAGLIDIQADSIAVSGDSRFEMISGGGGRAGRLKMTADNINLLDTSILAEARGVGLGGDIILQGGDITWSNVLVDASVKIAGEGGLLSVLGDTLTLDQSLVNITAAGVGKGGNFRATAEVFNASGLKVVTDTRGAGDGGSIAIDATTINLNAQTSLNAETLDSGNAGRITLTADTVNLAGGSIVTTSKAAGEGGRIGIDATSFNMTRGSALRSDSLGTGGGGNINIMATDLQVSDAGIDAFARGGGAGGVVELSATRLTLSEGATINVSALAGEGDAGRIGLAAETLMLDQARLASDTTGAGRGGDIDLSGTSVSVINGALISSSASGVANAGNIRVLASKAFVAVDSTVQSAAQQSGGGSIVITAVDRIKIDNSVISASASGLQSGDDGGNVTIDPLLFTLRQSQIVAQANVGDGGNIALAANLFVADTETLISASSARGIDGEVAIESPNQAANPVSADLNTGFQVLPDFINKRCVSNTQADRSYLVVENMYPVRRDPNDYLHTSAPAGQDLGLGTGLTTISLAGSTSGQRQTWRPGCD